MLKYKSFDSVKSIRPSGHVSKQPMYFLNNFHDLHKNYILFELFQNMLICT